MDVAIVGPEVAKGGRGSERRGDVRDWYRGEGMEWTYRVGAGVLLLR